MNEISRKERRALERSLRKQARNISPKNNDIKKKSFLKNSLIIGGLLLSLGIGGVLFNYVSKTPEQENQQTYQSYQPIINQANPSVEILSFSHPIVYDKLTDKEKEMFRDHAQRTIATLKALKEKGLEDIVLDGLTDEYVKDLSVDPQSIKSVGDQAIFINPILRYLTSSGWYIHGPEDPIILEKIQEHRDNINNIYNQHRIDLITNIILKIRDIENLSEFRLISSDLIDKYSRMMSSEVRKYMAENGDEFYNLVTGARDRRMLIRIKELVNSGKKVVFLGGSGHGMYLKEELLHHGTSFSFYADDPAILNNTKENDKKRFFEIETPPERYNTKEIIEEVTDNIKGLINNK